MNGDVRLRVEGCMLERLLNRALSEGAQFRRAERIGKYELSLSTDPISAEILRSLCERFSLPCAITECRGRSALLDKLRRRSTLLAAVMVFLASMSLFFSRVWIVDVLPADHREIDVSPLSECLSAFGVRPGMLKSSLDVAALQSALSAAAPEYSFVGVRLEGVRLHIEAAPAVPEPELFALNAGRDLVAACDGVVVSLNVQAGVACVEPGDTVTRGQTLIRGEERVSKEETRAIAALGDVIARTWAVGEASAPTHRTERTRTGRQSVAAELRLLRFAWPLLQGECYSSQETQTEILPVGGLFLPLEIVQTTVFETVSQTVAENADALEQSLTTLASAQANLRWTLDRPDATLCDQWLETSRDDEGLLRVRVVLELNSNIAVTRDTLYQQGGTRIGND